ncbi:MAG: TonB-dependent receptor [Bacteroidales bacterium]|nr:TonB-dependent receptor [Bacteroidales bacterium]
MMSCKRVVTLFFVSVLLIAFGNVKEVNAQSAKGSVKGIVIDAQSEEKLQYVNVAVLQTKDSSMVNGVITDQNGNFSIKNLRYGKYIVKFSFIGYRDVFKNVEIKSTNLDLGTIELRTASEILEGVEIVAERQMMEYKLDKRVINVDKNIVSVGGSASDVLENVPSVSVDEEGEVSLRGNSNVKILIDGKPSELLGNDLASVLAQIPASSIENIEVITNPSAKYDPEGMSGIINIKLKEKGNAGLNGNVNVSAGSSLEKFMPRTNGSASVSYSTKKFGFSASIDGRYNERGRRQDNMKILYGDTPESLAAWMRSKRDGSEKGWSEGVKLGFDWYISPKQTLTLGYNGRGHKSPSDNNVVHNMNIIDSMSMRSLDQITNGNDNGQFHTFSLNYQKKFNKPDQELMIDANWNLGRFNRESTQKIDYFNDIFDNNFEFDKKDVTASRNNRAVVNVNYSHPFTENLRMETGYNLHYSKRNSAYDYFWNGETLRDDSISYQFESQEFIHALYATFGYTYGKWSGQLGLRGEIVKSNAVKRMMYDDDVAFEKDYISPFPTLHLSYQITQTQSAQFSYSRRINRPNMWTMMPNVDLSNPEHIRFGNPDIDPEYTNAIELGYSNIFPKTTLFTSVYYRQTSNRISWFNFLWTEENARRYGFDWVLDVAGDEVDKGKVAMTSLNIANSFNYGIELIIDQQITKWWKVNLNANFFGSYTDATLINDNEINSFNWDAKLNSTMNLPQSWVIQFSAQYFAPRTTIQGNQAYFFYSDIAVKKSLNKRATISLRISDLMRTARRKGKTIADDYTSFNFGRPYRNSIMLNFSYRFGDSMPKPPQKRAKRLDDGSGSENAGAEAEE